MALKIKRQADTVPPFFFSTQNERRKTWKAFRKHVEIVNFMIRYSVTNLVVPASGKINFRWMK